MLRQFEESQSGQALLEYSVQALPQPPNTGGQETEEATSPSGSGHAMCMLWPNQPVVSRPLPRHRRIQRVDLPPLQHFDRLRWQIPGRRPEVAYVSRANWSIKEKTMEAILQTIYDEENQPSAYALYKLAQKTGHFPRHIPPGDLPPYAFPLLLVSFEISKQLPDSFLGFACAADRSVAEAANPPSEFICDVAVVKKQLAYSATSCTWRAYSRVWV